jgi:dicarboxylate transporter 10
MLVESKLMQDNIYTHLFSSFAAASAATVLTMPVDVLKTRMQNAKPGEFKGVGDCFLVSSGFCFL